MARDKTRSLQRGKSNRNITANKIGSPSGGANGDIQIRQTNTGAQLFGKLGGRWHGVPLVSQGIMKIGTSLSNHLSIGSSKLEFSSASKKVVSIGSGGITLNTLSGKSNECPLILKNDGTGNNRIAMSGANPEIRMGFDADGTTSNVAGSSKLYINMDTDALYMASVNFARAGSVKFVMGSTYESTTDELRIVAGNDPRTEANASIRINASGHIGFHGVSPVAQASHIANATDLADSITRINAILVVLENKGLTASS